MPDIFIQFKFFQDINFRVMKQLPFMYWDQEKELYVGVHEKDGAICPYYILENPRSRNAAGLYAIRQDLTEARNAIQYLIDQPDSLPIIKKNLLFSAVVQYAKAYTGSQDRWAQLNSNQVFQGWHLEAMEFHNATMALRHQYLAHAGDSPHESRVLVALLNPDTENKNIESVFYNSFKLINDDSNLDRYIAMIEIAINYVENKLMINKVSHDAEVAALDLGTMYAASKTPVAYELVEIPNIQQ